MPGSLTPRRFGDHRNAFGFLRLLFASLVIVSHVPEVVDGDRRRELLSLVFGTMSFGDFAVNGFFVISGFLITGSYLTSSGPRDYLVKRIARIYPAFVASSFICVLIVAPLAGGYPEHGWAKTLGGMVARAGLLERPYMAGVFEGTHYAALNGPAWTIQYEFLCYAIVLILGVLGALRLPFVVVMTLAALGIAAIDPSGISAFVAHLPLHSQILTATSADAARLLAMFSAGACFYLARRHIPLSATLTWVSAALLCACLCLPNLATIGFAIFGSYLIFASAAYGAGTFLGSINNANDISYGVYLYAWPAQKLLLWGGLPPDLLLLGVLTWLIAAGAGALSWFGLERPTMKWARTSLLMHGARR